MSVDDENEISLDFGDEQIINVDISTPDNSVSISETEINIDILDTSISIDIINQEITLEVQPVSEYLIDIDISDPEISIDIINAITILKDGVKVANVRAINFETGNNTTLIVNQTGNRANVKIDAQAGGGGGGSGDVVGPSIAISGNIVFFDGTTGKQIKDSGYSPASFDGAGAAASVISDAAYGSGWNGVTGIAPSKNAVYDQMELKAPLDSPTFTGTVTTPAIIVSSETPSRVAIIDASKNVKSADTSTYPDLTELSYLKGAYADMNDMLELSYLRSIYNLIY